MYIGCHNHTDHSNYRLLDSINRIEDLITYSKELGHSGVAITDHESVGNHVRALHTMRDLKNKDPEKWKDYKLILGNEIYLCDRDLIQNKKEYVFPHFVLLAKNLNGHKCIRELSSIAYCENSFTHVNLRVPTFEDDLIEKMKSYKGDVIASTACVGGALPRMILIRYNENPYNPNLDICKEWIEKMNYIFGEGNFFLELQPSIQEDQKIVNKYLIELSKETNTPYIITTDAHYLKKEDRKIHEAFLQSQEADREVADFYEATYVMSEKEIHKYLDSNIGYDAVQKGIDNTILIYDMVEEYSLDKPLSIPYIPDDESDPDPVLLSKYMDKIELFDYFAHSDYPSDRHLVREIIKKFEEKPEEFQNEESYEATQVCLESIKLASDKQNTPWSAYLLQTKALIQLCWDSNTLVGAGRGSGVGFFLLYVLDITQINPLREDVKTYHWRFLNPERVSPLDIDTDIIGEMKDIVVENLKKKYGGYHHVCKVQTISTSAPKKSIQIACRGLGYTPEEGMALSAFIKSERGITFTLHQTYYGDEENGLSPDKEFVNLMNNKYPDVWEVAQKIEGLCVGTGEHAGGVILSKEDFDESTALMKTKAGGITTQFDLHDCEDCGLIKWDILAIDALGKMKIELDLLIQDGLIEWQGDLKSTYEKYLGVYSIDRNNPEIWNLIDRHKILSLFQFEKQSGWNAIESGQPKTLEAMSALNSVMRLMAQEPGGEAPLQRYARMRNDISEWYKEMDEWGLTKEEQKWLEQYALKNYGLLPNQENFMIIVQDPMIGGYSLLWADKLRKAIAKKNPKAFNELQDEFFENVSKKGLSEKLCEYVWKVLICMSKGYGFNTSHTLAYSIVALQEANLAYKYPMVYWNCANLISDSGGLDSTVNYGKNAVALSRMRREGIEIAPPYINEARFDFRPYADQNKILFGLKAIRGVGAAEAQTIVANQPYSSVEDFLTKMTECKEKDEESKFGNTTMIQLIKAGCFDNIDNRSRVEIMEEFVRSISKPITALKMSNIDELLNNNLIPKKFIDEDLKFLRYKNLILRKENLVEMSGKTASTGFYMINIRIKKFFEDNFAADMKLIKDYKFGEGNSILVKKGSLDKAVDKKLENFKNKVFNNPDVLKAYNDIRFNKIWNEKCGGSISKWEMDSMCYYYHDHELQTIDKDIYGVTDFFKLPTVPETRGIIKFKDKEIPRYVITAVCGTVVDKNAAHSTISLLTPTGAIEVKFAKGDYNFYAKTLVGKKEDGTKKTIDASWFDRGTKLIICGTRIGEVFTAKKYSDTSRYNHKVTQVIDIDEKGKCVLLEERPQEE